jgi:hypothetical protein
VDRLLYQHAVWSSLTEAGMYKEVNGFTDKLQFDRTSKESFSVILVILELVNAATPMTLRDEGKTTLSNLHPRRAFSPIYFNVLEYVMLDRLEQLWKALDAILSIVFGITRDVMPQHENV